MKQNNNNNNYNKKFTLNNNPLHTHNNTIHLIHYTNFTQLQFHHNNQTTTLTFPLTNHLTLLIPYLLQFKLSTTLNYYISNSEHNQPQNPHNTSSDLILYTLQQLLSPDFL